MKLKGYISLAFLITCMGVSAQNIFVRAVPGEGTVRIKWITDELIVPGGTMVYRSENNGPWQLLTQEPLKIGGHSVSAENQEKAIRLQKLFADPSFDYGGDPVVTLVLLNTIIPNEELSRYLGIEFHDNSASNGGVYQYKITKAGTEKEIGTTDEIQMGTGYLEPAPTGIVTKQKNKSVSIGWKNESLRYYGVNIYRQIPDSPSTRTKMNEQPILYSEGKGSDKNTYQFVDNTIEKGITYEYTLVTVDYFGEEGENSGPFTLAAQDILPPPYPKNLKFEPDHKTLSVTLAWDGTLTEDHAGFEILHSKNDTNNFRTIRRGIHKDSNYAFINLSENGRHYFKIVAVDQSGNKATSEADFVELEDKTGPSAPSGVEITTDSGKVILKWKPNTEPDLLGYYVYRQKSAGSGLLRVTPDPLREAVFTEQFAQNFVSNITYTIVAKDTNGNLGASSEPISVEFKDHNPPDAPQLQDISYEEGIVSLKWLPPVNADLNGFRIFRNSSTDSTWKQVNLTEIPPTSTAFSDRGTEPGTSYTYRLIAYDTAQNESVFSNLKTITVPAEIQEVQVLEFKAGLNKRSKQVNLTWKVGQPENVRAYMVFASSVTDNTLVPVSGMITENSFQHSPEEAGTISYVLKVFDTKGRKIISQPTTITLEK